MFFISLQFLNRFTKLLKYGHTECPYYYFVVDIAELQIFGSGRCISAQVRNQNGVGIDRLQLPPPASNREKKQTL